MMRALVILVALAACDEAGASASAPPEPKGCPIPGETLAASCTADGCLVCYRNLSDGNMCRFLNPQMCRQ